MANLIYIGNLAALDTDESDYDNENDAAVQGTYGSGDMSNVDVEMSADTRAGVTYSDDNGNSGDTFTYDTGSGETTSVLDAEARYAAKITDENGDVHEVNISVYQTQNGDTFVRLPDGYQVQQLEIGEVVGDNYGGVYQNSSSTSTVVCFVAGTQIETETGPVPIERLRVGDKVWTQDHAFQPITWIEHWVVKRTDKTAPIAIAPGALGPGAPAQELCVSRQHRLLVSSKIVQRMFGKSAVLVPAHVLTGLPGIAQVARGGPVHYYHFTCPAHEIVRANGQLAETLLPGTQAKSTLKSLAKTAPKPGLDPRAARPIAPVAKARQLIRRHMAHAMPFEGAGR